MSGWGWRVGVVVAVLCGALIALDTVRPPVVLIVEGGHYRTAPADIRLLVRVEPHRDNRLLTVGVESDAFAAASDEDLDGESPRSRWKVFRDVPAGAYTAYAVVRRGPAETWHASEVFVVLGHD